MLPNRTQTLLYPQPPRAFLRRLFDAAVARAQPARVLPGQVPALPLVRTLVIDAGNAGGAMAAALNALWPVDAPLSGVVAGATALCRRPMPRP